MMSYSEQMIDSKAALEQMYEYRDGDRRMKPVMPSEDPNRIDMVKVLQEGLYEKGKKTPLDVQEGGDHYKKMGIQPVEYIHANDLGYCEGNIVKYITRHRMKGGAEDIRKVIHYAQLMLQLEYEMETE